jgi:hypothetical protein
MIFIKAGFPLFYLRFIRVFIKLIVVFHASIEQYH